MNKIDLKLKELKKKKRLGLMTHVVVGYPSLPKTISLVKVMDESRVDFVELQIPFSDPLADGPTIMKACEKSLANGTKVKDAFDIASKLSKEVSASLLFMAYFNTVFKYGVEKFCKDSKEAGISGLIVPDMPIEEEKCENFMKFCQKYELKHIRVISPASTSERLTKNAKIENGFVYATARQGITGIGKKLNPDTISYLSNLREYFKIPIAVGFGISKKSDLKLIKPYAEIAVVGSAIIEIINKSEYKSLEKNVTSFINSIKL